MDGGGVEQAAGEAVAALRAAVDGLLALDPFALTGPAITELASRVEVERRRLESVDQQIIAAMDEHRVAGDYARASTADLLVQLVRVDPGEARARVARARDMGPRRTFGGAPLEPIFAVVAAAQRDGLISSAHARVVVTCIEKLPPHVAHEVAPWAEQQLVEAALKLPPRQLGAVAERLLAHLDPDGTAPSDEEHQRRRQFGLRHNADGSSVPYGRLTPGLTAMLQTIIDTLAAPQHTDPSSAPDPADTDRRDGDGGGRDGSGRDGSDRDRSDRSGCGERDERSSGQRQHDALADMCTRLLRAGTLPDSGGTPVTLIVHLNDDLLRERTGHATTDHDAPIPTEEVLHLAGEADIIPVVLSDTGGVTCYGRTRRCASPAQRRALAARDRGCCYPGCRRPPSWTQAHHIIRWEDGGLTDLENLCLLCAYHHRVFESRGWQVIMRDGAPWWIPPAWLDHERKPVRNSAHHIPEFDFDAA